MSVRRPGRRYIGFTYRPPGATRREVARALEQAVPAAGPGGARAPPRLLVCEGGSAILVVPTPQAAGVRAALAGPPGAATSVRMEAVVTSGTIATVKERMGLERRRRR